MWGETYTIDFNKGTTNGTNISSSIPAVATLCQSGSDNISAVNTSSNCYYNASGCGVRLAKSGGAGTFKITLSNTIKAATVSKVVVYASKVSGNTTSTLKVTPTGTVTTATDYNNSALSAYSTSSSASTNYELSEITINGTLSTLQFEAPSKGYVMLHRIDIVTGSASGPFTVTYDANGATKGSVPTDATKYEKDATVTVKANNTGDDELKKTGYTYAGWNTKADASGTDYAANATFTITANTTLYAKWTANNYNVTFDKNAEDATGSMEPQQITFDQSANLTANAFTRAHHTFSGWATTASGTKSYNDKASYKMTSEGATLYAVWTADKTTVTLNKDGGTGGNSSVTASYGQAMPSAGNVPTKTGYTFTGYYTEQNGQGTKYYNADNTSAQNWDKDDATATLYAGWEAKTITLTLNKGDHGQANGTATIVYGTSTLVTHTFVEPITGYTVDGYYTTASGGSKVLNADGTLGSQLSNWIDANGNCIKSADATLYAHFSPINYTVNWVSNGSAYDGEGGSTNADYNTKVAALPTEPSVDGSEKVFVGWTATSNYTHASDKPSDLFKTAADAPAVTGNTTYYAVYADRTGDVLPYSFTINYTDFTTGGYSANDGDHNVTATCTSDAEKTMTVTYKTSNVYQNSNKMQFKGSSGKLYNTTDLGTITNVSVTSGSNVTTYYGTTSQPTSGTSVGTGNGYFNVKAGSSTGYATSITVSFSQANYTYTNYSTTVAQSTKTQLTTPANLSHGTPTKTVANLSWDAVTNAGSYKVEYKATSDAVYTTVSPSPTTNSCQLTGLTESTEYTWRVTAIPSDVENYRNSESASDNFTTADPLANPVLDVAEGTYTEDQYAYVDNYDENCIYAFTTDGTDPTFDEELNVTNGEEYDKDWGIDITSTTVVKIVANNGTELSDIVRYIYIIKPEDALFYESFDTNEGTGGNDDKWSGSIAANDIASDNTGWTFANEKGANKCAKFGSGSAAGSAKTPAITLSGNAKITFKAAAWNGNSEETTLNLSATSGTLSQTSVTMTKGAWTLYTVEVSGVEESTQITFAASQASNNRFFLDEVLVEEIPTVSATISDKCYDEKDGVKTYYSTFSTPNYIKVPAGVTVSEVGLNNDGTLKVASYQTGDVVESGIGLLISSATSGTKYFEVVPSFQSAPTTATCLGDGNLLHGTNGDDIDATTMKQNPANCLYYRLTMHNGTQIGFYWGAPDGAEFELGKNKAYLAVPKSQAGSVKAQGFWFGGDDETAISQIENGKLTIENGKYLQNGRIVIVKNGKKYNTNGQRIK